MSDPSQLLEVVDLHAGYGKNAVLRGVSLRIAPGEVVGLIGRNGAGKTTTARVISGLVPRKSGSLRFTGSQLSSSAPTVARAGIAHVPQGRRLFSGLTVRENLQAGAYATGEHLTKSDIDEILHVFPPLEKLLERRAGLLSGGEQQMVAIGRGLAARPTMMIVDELSLGLAPIIVDFTWTALLSLRDDRGVAILVIDQNTELIMARCDRAYHLEDGSMSELHGEDRDDVGTASFGVSDL